MKPIPFNLERAKAGDTILWEGRPAKFLLHIPEAADDSKVVILMESGVVTTTTECGRRVKSAINPTLTMAPKKRVVWVNMYDCASNSFGYATKEEADRALSRDRIACVRVEFEEGEGL